MKRSEAFEQQIRRIYELLLDSAAEVTWNDHIPDPDNPAQRRQIDLTIERGGKLTLVECRKHKSRQDVQWIEELIGRRMSLGADALIAVSDSGFTTGALKKAKAYGVIPRDLSQLTDPEIKSWGRQVALTLFFYEYSDLEVSLLFKRESIRKVDEDTVKSEFRCHPGMQSLFNAAAQELGKFNLVADEHASLAAPFAVRLQLAGLSLSGESVIGVDFRGNAHLVSRTVSSSAVFAYGEPSPNPEQEDATLEMFPLGETSIIHDKSRISVLIDISQLEMPPFCQFRFFRVTGEEEMDHQTIELVGLDKLWVSRGSMTINIRSL
jgi:hypothetical protein